LEIIEWRFVSLFERKAWAFGLYGRSLVLPKIIVKLELGLFVKRVVCNPIESRI